MAKKNYYTYIILGDFPVRENTPHLYPTRAACVKDIIAAIKTTEGWTTTKEEWKGLESEIRQAFAVGDTFTDLWCDFDYVILKCRLETPKPKGKNSKPSVSKKSK